MIKLGVSGASGRMGQRIIALAKADSVLDVSFGLEAKTCSSIGEVIDGVKIVDNLDEIKNCDCLIDFSSPLATLDYVEGVVKYNKRIVIGTTGLDRVLEDKIKELSKEVPIILSPNMSVGVNVLFKLLKVASGILSGYSVEVEETHHIHKKDSPSGTAKKIVQIINDNKINITPEDVNAIREGEVVGDHKVVFKSDVDNIVLSHSAKTRDIFAQGALVAAKWIMDKSAGLYSMEDVLFS